MNEINAIIECAEQAVSARGKQLTAGRKLILTALLDADRALSAYELVDYCKLHFNQSIQPMSVYRVLEFLEGEHLAHKLRASNKYTICSRVYSELNRTDEDEHGISQFLICSKCGKTSEKPAEPKLINSLLTHAQIAGFTLTNPQIELNCVCDNCAQ